MSLKGRIENGKLIIEGSNAELEILKNIIDENNFCEKGCCREGEKNWEKIQCEDCWVNEGVEWEDKKDIEKKNIMKKTVVFDFDGVIHKGYKGYKDGTIYGEIDKELVEWIEELRSKDVHVCIVSNRDSKQIINFMGKWCAENDINLHFMKTEELFWDSCGSKTMIGVSNRKVAGMIYIDDKGYRYEGLKKLKGDFEEIFKIEKK